MRILSVSLEALQLMMSKVFKSFFVAVCFLSSSFIIGDGLIGFNASIKGIPASREDGTPMASSEIKGFRVFIVGESGLKALTPDIDYNQEVEAKGVVFMSTSVSEGAADLCVMTLDNFGLLSDCSDVVPVNFSVSPPSSPSNTTFSQSVTFNITVSN